MGTRIKKAVIILIGVVLMITATACGEPKPTEYVDSFQQLINDNTALYKELTTAVEKYLTDFAEEQKTQINTVLTSLNEKYTALGEMKTPKIYAEVEPMFKAASDSAVAAIAIYTEEFGKITKETFTASNTALLTRLEEADKMMEQANQKTIEAVTKVREIGGEDEKSSEETSSAEGDKKEDGSSDAKEETDTTSKDTASKE